MLHEGDRAIETCSFNVNFDNYMNICAFIRVLIK